MPNHNPPTGGFNKNPDNINKEGRPKLEWTWSSLIKEAMEELAEDGVPIKKKVSQSLVLKALTGDVQAIKEIGDRIDGKAKQAIEHSGEIKGNTIVFTEFKEGSDEAESE